MSEVIAERHGSTFQLFDHAFGGIPTPLKNMLESETVAVTGRLQPGYAINQKEWVADEMFLAELGKEHLGQVMVLVG